MTRPTCHRCGEYAGDCDAACLRAQLDECRATVKKLNRRAQAAEGCPACRKAVLRKETEGMTQPAPTPNGMPAILPLVIADLEQRGRVGLETYGTPLKPFNGRDALEDAYAKALDMCMYLKQAIIERNRSLFRPEAAALLTRPSEVGQ